MPLFGPRSNVPDSALDSESLRLLTDHGMHNQTFVGAVPGSKDERVIIGDVGRMLPLPSCPKCVRYSWGKGETVKEKHAAAHPSDPASSIGLPALCLYGVLLFTMAEGPDATFRRHALVRVDLRHVVAAHIFPRDGTWIRVLSRKLKVLDFVDQLQMKEPIRSIILAQPPEWHAYIDALQPRTWREFFIQAVAPLGQYV